MRLRIQKSPLSGQCLVCGKDLGLLRRLQGAAFCSEEHQEQFLNDLGELGVTRLQDAEAGTVCSRSTAV
jgi:hypothetical protein